MSLLRRVQNSLSYHTAVPEPNNTFITRYCVRNEQRSMACCIRIKKNKHTHHPDKQLCMIRVSRFHVKSRTLPMSCTYFFYRFRTNTMCKYGAHDILVVSFARRILRKRHGRDECVLCIRRKDLCASQKSFTLSRP